MSDLWRPDQPAPTLTDEQRRWLGADQGNGRTTADYLRDAGDAGVDVVELVRNPGPFHQVAAGVNPQLAEQEKDRVGIFGLPRLLWEGIRDGGAQARINDAWYRALTGNATLDQVRQYEADQRAGMADPNNEKNYGFIAETLDTTGEIIGQMGPALGRGLGLGLGGASLGALGGAVAGGPLAPLTAGAGATVGFGIGMAGGVISRVMTDAAGYSYRAFAEMEFNVYPDLDNPGRYLEPEAYERLRRRDERYTQAGGYQPEAVPMPDGIAKGVALSMGAAIGALELAQLRIPVKLLQKTGLLDKWGARAVRNMIEDGQLARFIQVRIGRTIAAGAQETGIEVMQEVVSFAGTRMANELTEMMTSAGVPVDQQQPFLDELRSQMLETAKEVAAPMLLISAVPGAAGGVYEWSTTRAEMRQENARRLREADGTTAGYFQQDIGEDIGIDDIGVETGEFVERDDAAAAAVLGMARQMGIPLAPIPVQVREDGSVWAEDPLAAAMVRVAKGAGLKNLRVQRRDGSIDPSDAVPPWEMFEGSSIASQIQAAYPNDTAAEVQAKLMILRLRAMRDEMPLEEWVAANFKDGILFQEAAPAQAEVAAEPAAPEAPAEAVPEEAVAPEAPAPPTMDMVLFRPPQLPAVPEGVEQEEAAGPAAPAAPQALLGAPAPRPQLPAPPEGGELVTTEPQVPAVPEAEVSGVPAVTEPAAPAGEAPAPAALPAPPAPPQLTLAGFQPPAVIQPEAPAGETLMLPAPEARALIEDLRESAEGLAAAQQAEPTVADAPTVALPAPPPQRLIADLRSAAAALELAQRAQPPVPAAPAEDAAPPAPAVEPEAAPAPKIAANIPEELGEPAPPLRKTTIVDELTDDRHLTEIAAEFERLFDTEIGDKRIHFGVDPRLEEGDVLAYELPAPDGRAILFHPDLTQEERAGIALHELGHTLEALDYERLWMDLDAASVAGTRNALAGAMTPLGRELLEGVPDAENVRDFTEWYADQLAVYMADPEREAASTATRYFRDLAQNLIKWFRESIFGLDSPYLTDEFRSYADRIVERRRASEAEPSAPTPPAEDAAPPSPAVEPEPAPAPEADAATQPELAAPPAPAGLLPAPEAAALIEDLRESAQALEDSLQAEPSEPGVPTAALPALGPRKLIEDLQRAAMALEAVQQAEPPVPAAPAGAEAPAPAVEPTAAPSPVMTAPQPGVPTVPDEVEAVAYEEFVQTNRVIHAIGRVVDEIDFGWQSGQWRTAGEWLEVSGLSGVIDPSEIDVGEGQIPADQWGAILRERIGHTAPIRRRAQEIITPEPPARPEPTPEPIPPAAPEAEATGQEPVTEPEAPAAEPPPGAPEPDVEEVQRIAAQMAAMRAAEGLTPERRREIDAEMDAELAAAAPEAVPNTFDGLVAELPAPPDRRWKPPQQPEDLDRLIERSEAMVERRQAALDDAESDSAIDRAEERLDEAQTYLDELQRIQDEWAEIQGGTEGEILWAEIQGGTEGEILRSSEEYLNQVEEEALAAGDDAMAEAASHIRADRYAQYPGSYRLLADHEALFTPLLEEERDRITYELAMNELARERDALREERRAKLDAEQEAAAEQQAGPQEPTEADVPDLTSVPHHRTGIRKPDLVERWVDEDVSEVPVMYVDAGGVPYILTGKAAFDAADARADQAVEGVVLRADDGVSLEEAQAIAEQGAPEFDTTAAPAAEPGRTVITEDDQQTGAVEFDQAGKAALEAYDAADFKTWVHQLARVFRRLLTPDEERVAARWSGVETARTAGEEFTYDWTPEAEYRFASGFEQYLREGKVEVQELQPIWTNLSNMLTASYAADSARLHPAVRDVFEGLLVDRASPSLRSYAANLRMIGEVGEMIFRSPASPYILRLVAGREEDLVDDVPEGLQPASPRSPLPTSPRAAPIQPTPTRTQPAPAQPGAAPATATPGPGPTAAAPQPVQPPRQQRETPGSTLVAQRVRPHVEALNQAGDVVMTRQYPSLRAAVKDISGVPTTRWPATIGHASFRPFRAQRGASGAFLGAGPGQRSPDPVEMNAPPQPPNAVWIGDTPWDQDAWREQAIRQLDDLGPLQQSKISEYLTSWRRYDYLTELLASGVEGPLYQLLSRDMDTARRAELGYRQRVRGLLRSKLIQRGWTEAEIRAMPNTMNEQVEVEGLPKPKVEDMPEHWTVGEILSIHRHLRSGQNRAALLTGGLRIGPEGDVLYLDRKEIRALMRAWRGLPEKVREFGTSIIDEIMDFQHAALDPVHQKARGRPLGYIPYYWDLERSPLDRGPQDADPDPDVDTEGDAVDFWRGDDAVKITVYGGMVKQRGARTAPVVLRTLDFQLMRSLDHAAMYIGFEVPMRAARSMWTDPRAVAAMERRIGKGAVDGLRSGLEGMARRWIDEGNIDKVAAQIQRGVTVSTLGGNIGVWIKQTLSLPLYNTFVPMRYLAASNMRAAIAGEFGEMNRQLETFDPTFIARQKGFDVSLLGSLKLSQAFDAWGKRRLSDMFMSGIQFFDKRTVVVGSHAAMLQALDEFRTGRISEEVRRATGIPDGASARALGPDGQLEKAYLYANWVTARTQPNFLPEHVSQWQRHRLTRFLAMFSGYTNVAYNLVLRTAWRARHHGSEEAWDAARKAFFYVFVANTVGAMMIDFLKDILMGTAPEEDELPSWVARKTVNSLSAPVYLLRDATYAFTTSGEVGIPLTSAGTDVITAFRMLSEDLVEGEIRGATVGRLVTAAGIGTGMPLGSIYRYGQRGYEVLFDPFSQ